MVEQSKWMARVAQNPGHSQWYVDRFRTMAARGEDIVGEARLVDAMAPRGARILDAGCGAGRLSGYLHTAGHTVVGVDVDPQLLEAAREDHPGPDYRVADLATLPELSLGGAFDLIVCAGNVVTFLAESTRRDVLRGFRTHLAPGGRAVVGFGVGRGYPARDFLADAAAEGLAPQLTLGGWDLAPWTKESDFLVAVLAAGGE
ncbi:bifunctional 2-polyprenyl-6-hydroxyphenol methylase/3-demethylubiquinol 3-O-methyltransferase UbiG [Kocuria sp.]|uniref:class I SAM-dependent methyltransferase n=1 Tax=Kocuria sp. TaxID=1871328 RepID=UPI0026DCCCE6|nr:class I SAM-dependent methyltransferase [Kocuria sp.]MDO4919842.1 class I SAM-dependent methyltransferase [Kocuria sp.]